MDGYTEDIFMLEEHEKNGIKFTPEVLINQRRKEITLITSKQFLIDTSSKEHNIIVTNVQSIDRHARTGDRSLRRSTRPEGHLLLEDCLEIFARVIGSGPSNFRVIHFGRVIFLDGQGRCERCV